MRGLQGLRLPGEEGCKVARLPTYLLCVAFDRDNFHYFFLLFVVGYFSPRDEIYIQGLRALSILQ